MKINEFLNWYYKEAGMKPTYEELERKIKQVNNEVNISIKCDAEELMHHLQKAIFKLVKDGLFETIDENSFSENLNAEPTDLIRVDLLKEKINYVEDLIFNKNGRR